VHYIPQTVRVILTNNDLMPYSTQVKLTKSGCVLRMSCMFPYLRFKWEPLDEEESVDMVRDVRKELKKKGYRSKVRRKVEFDGTKNLNVFEFRILLKEGDLPHNFISSLEILKKEERIRSKSPKKRYRLSDQL